MSLRDQLIAKGLASKKQARKANQQLREQRKKGQGSRTKKSKAQRKAEAAERAAKEAAAAQRQAARDEAAAAREGHEHVYRVRDIVMARAVQVTGPVPFRHRVGDTARTDTMRVSQAVARDLRNGTLAIAGYRDEQGQWHHRVVEARAAAKLHDIEPAAVVHWVQDASGLGDPAEAPPPQRAWEPDLKARRVSASDDLAALIARERARDAARGKA